MCLIQLTKSKKGNLKNGLRLPIKNDSLLFRKVANHRPEPKYNN